MHTRSYPIPLHTCGSLPFSRILLQEQSIIIGLHVLLPWLWRYTCCRVRLIALGGLRSKAIWEKFTWLENDCRVVLACAHYGTASVINHDALTLLALIGGVYVI